MWPVEVLAVEWYSWVVPLVEGGCAAGRADVLWRLPRHVVDDCVHVDPGVMKGNMG